MFSKEGKPRIEIRSVDLDFLDARRIAGTIAIKGFSND